jgi:hypothetical protein
MVTSFESSSFAPLAASLASIFPCHPGAEMPPPATGLGVSWAKAVAETTSVAAKATAIP